MLGRDPETEISQGNAVSEAGAAPGSDSRGDCCRCFWGQDMSAGECAQCGECCKWIVLRTDQMTPEYLQYLRCRGLREDQGFILVPHECQHLHIENFKFGGTLEDAMKHYCDIHDSPDRPRVCKVFHGQRQGSRHWKFYCPPGCAMRGDHGID